MNDTANVPDAQDGVYRATSAIDGVEVSGYGDTQEAAAQDLGRRMLAKVAGTEGVSAGSGPSEAVAMFANAPLSDEDHRRAIGRLVRASRRG